MDKVLSEIQSAETEAANMIARAKGEAAAIIEDAKVKCSEISETKIKEAQQSAETAVSDAKKEADALYNKIISEYCAKCADTEKTAQANVSAAADAIIKNLV